MPFRHRTQMPSSFEYFVTINVRLSSEQPHLSIGLHAVERLVCHLEVYTQEPRQLAVDAA